MNKALILFLCAVPVLRGSAHTTLHDALRAEAAPARSAGDSRYTINLGEMRISTHSITAQQMHEQFERLVPAAQDDIRALFPMFRELQEHPRGSWPIDARDVQRWQLVAEDDQNTDAALERISALLARLVTQHEMGTVVEDQLHTYNIRSAFVYALASAVRNNRFVNPVVLRPSSDARVPIFTINPHDALRISMHMGPVQSTFELGYEMPELGQRSAQNGDLFAQVVVPLVAWVRDAAAAVAAVIS